MISSEDLLSLTLLGESDTIINLKKRICKTAIYDVPVLIHGETGTGKELVARSLHYCSTRSDQAFIPTNCGAISDELFLSEMFGHEKGAFTDAKISKSGLLEQANNGTLFLDEINSLSLRSQVALLRFLQDNEFRSVGGTTSKKANVRILAASNQDLKQLINQGKFREDLYFRLDVLNIFVPPLRDRSGDAVLLSNHFIQEVCEQHGLSTKKLSPSAQDWINNYSWPGNVRELENWIKRSCFLSYGDSIYANNEEAKPLDDSNCSAPQSCGIDSFKDAKSKAIEQFESSYINEVLTQCSGNISQAARVANKDRRAFGRLVKKHSVDRGLFC